MFGIGEFAALAGVTTRRLRLYDQLELLCPAKVDRKTGYRSYSARQLPRLNRILVLQDLRFTLDDIASILDSEPTVEEFWTMVRSQEAQVSAHLREEYARLERIRARLRQVQEYEQIPVLDVVEKDIPHSRVAVLGQRVSTFEPAYGPTAARLVAELFSRLRSANVRVPGRPIYFLKGRLGHDDFTFFVSFPIKSANTSDALDIVEFPAARAATIITSAQPTVRLETIRSAYFTLIRWIEDRHLTQLGNITSVTLETDVVDFSLAQMPNLMVLEHQLPVQESQPTEALVDLT
jgi:DNA-binding transcriptional MerR regulator